MISPFIKRHGFSLALACGMVLFHAACVAILLLAPSPDMRWVGANLFLSSETPFSLSLIEQGHFVLRNPYAIEPHRGWIDPLWSTLAAIRGATGVSPFVLHELAVLGGIIALAFALHAAARSIAPTEADARLGSLMMTGGVGVGWIHALVTGSLLAPDIASTFAITPTLLGSAHGIFTLVLLVTSIHGVWKSVHDRTRATLGVSLSVIGVTWLQPHVIPLLLAVLVVAWSKKITRRPAHERTHRPALVFAACLIPAVAYSAYALQDSILRELWLERFHPSLGSWSGWLFALAPSVVALAWLMRRHHREQRFLAVARWCMAWLMAAGALVILPVAWRGVFVSGLMIPLVLVTLPAWSTWMQKLPRVASVAIRAAIVGVTPLYLLFMHVAWVGASSHNQTLIQPQAVFRAWELLSFATNAVVIADNLTIGTWTPAWSGATSWIGPEQATPGFSVKHRIWKTIFTSEDLDQAARLLDETHTTHVLVSTPESLARFQALNRGQWKLVFHQENIVLLEKTGGR
jgi:hypothetical protein